MQRSSSLGLAVALSLACLLGGIALGQQMGDGADGKDAVPKRVERAERIAKALEKAKFRAEAADPIEAAYLEELSGALDDAWAMTKPVTLDELTEAERAALKDALAAEGDGGDGAGGGDDWQARMQERALSTAFEGADLTEQEEADATPIVSAWYSEFLAARRERDSKKESELKKQRDDDLKKLLGRKKANKVINNLNSLGGWGRGR